MAIDFLYPQYEVVRNNDRCINCRACERQCANEVHFWDADNKVSLKFRLNKVLFEKSVSDNSSVTEFSQLLNLQKFKSD